MNKLEKRIVEIAFRLQLNHIPAYFETLPILLEIYKTKKKDEPVILSHAHPLCTQAVVLEHLYGLDAFDIVKRNMTCGNRNKEDMIDVSTCSLGHGLTIALGMAIADRSKNVYVLTSDGEFSEGACWETLQIADELELYNIKIYLNANGYSCIKEVNLDKLEKRIKSFFPVKFIRTNVDRFPEWLQGYDGRYAVLDEERVKELLCS